MSKTPIGGGSAAVVWELDWPELESLAGVAFDAKRRETILHYVNTALLKRNMFNASPTDAAVKKRVERIGAVAAKLAKLLDDKTGDDAAIWIKAEAGREDVLSCEALWRYVGLCRRAAASRERVKKTGASEREWRDDLIKELHAIWTAAGGRGMGCHWNALKDKDNDEGPFLELCLAIWQAAELERIGRAGMAKAIRRTLRDKTEEN